VTRRARTARGRGVVALLGLVLTGVLTVGVLAPPERCPTVTPASLRASATEAVDWFTRNQRSDGRWLYLYDHDAGVAVADYNAIRHAGAILGLEQAATAGIPGARATSDAGIAWLLDRMIERDDWSAVSYRGEVAVGASALLVAALAERRTSTGSGEYDAALVHLGRFLVSQTETSGAVLAYYDAGTRAPRPGAYSKYYTGEAYWALARLHRLFPDDGWDRTADRIGAYLATERDDAEGGRFAIPDHWAAYGLAETVPSAPGDRVGRPLTGAERDYARHQAQLFGVQVRWFSQRFGPWGPLVRSHRAPRGGGYGVVGEGLSGLWRAARVEPGLAAIEGPVAERALCNAGLAIEAQSTTEETAGAVDADRVRGAWFRHGETRMDDQQHAISALLRAEAIAEAGVPAGRGPVPPAWLWVLALVAALNPARAAAVARGLPPAAAGPGRGAAPEAAEAAVADGKGEELEERAPGEGADERSTRREGLGEGAPGEELGDRAPGEDADERSARRELGERAPGEGPDGRSARREQVGEAAPGEGADERSARRERAAAAVLGGVAGALVALLAAGVAGLLAGVLDVSPPSLRTAAGAVAVAAGLVALVRRPPPSEPALTGWWAALVPVGLPAVANPALVLAALAAGLDRGLAVVLVALAVGVAVLTLLAARPTWDGGTTDGRAGRGLAWGARLTGVVLTASGVALVLEGVYAI